MCSIPSSEGIYSNPVWSGWAAHDQRAETRTSARIQYQHSRANERCVFSNYLGAILAARSHWWGTHVCAWIDNSTAVAWNNKRSSRNAFAQLLLRILALWEVRYHFYITSSHIPGVQNVIADARSRVWESADHNTHFTKLSAGWKQVSVPPSWRKLSQVWERCSVLELKQYPLKRCVRERGSSGICGVCLWDIRHGSCKTSPMMQLLNLGLLLFTYGDLVWISTIEVIPMEPHAWSCVLYDDIIEFRWDTIPVSTHSTLCFYGAFDVFLILWRNANLSRLVCYGASMDRWIFTSRNTNYSGAVCCWRTFSCCVVLNICI